MEQWRSKLINLTLIGRWCTSRPISPVEASKHSYQICTKTLLFSICKGYPSNGLSLILLTSLMINEPSKPVHTPELHYSAFFQALPGNSALLLPDPPTFTIAAVTEGYLQVSGRHREELIGKGLFAAFPASSDDPEQSTHKGLRDSLEQVLLKKEPHRFIYGYSFEITVSALATKMQEKYSAHLPACMQRTNLKEPAWVYRFAGRLQKGMEAPYGQKAKKGKELFLLFCYQRAETVRRFR